MWCSTLDIVISYSQQELIDITLSIACSAARCVDSQPPNLITLHMCQQVTSCWLFLLLSLIHFVHKQIAYY